MNWEIVSASAEILGALGVIVSLLYLARQISSNSRTVEASTSHAIAKSKNELNIAVATDPALAGILTRGAQDYSSLTIEDRFRFAMYMHAVVNIYEDSFNQFVRGLSPETVWREDLAYLVRILSPPEMKTWWDKNKAGRGAEFQQSVDALLAAQSTPHPIIE